jgi:hypothetical protein
MRRLYIATCAAAVGAAAFAQGGDLRNVTMRVLDDLRDVDAVVIELGASSGDDAAAEGERAGRDADSAARDGAAGAAKEADRFAERKELHDPDDDEAAEGRLEDRDVEQPAAPTP